MRFEEKSTFRSGQEESEQEVIAAAIVLCDAVDVVVGERRIPTVVGFYEFLCVN